MEYPIRIVIIVIVLVVVALVILSLFGVFGERSNWLIEGIFGFFTNLFGDGGAPSGGGTGPDAGSSGSPTNALNPTVDESYTKPPSG